MFVPIEGNGAEHVGQPSVLLRADTEERNNNKVKQLNALNPPYEAMQSQMNCPKSLARHSVHQSKGTEEFNIYLV